VWKNWFAQIDSIDQARKAARQGGLGGLLFAASYVAGLAFAFLARTNPSDNQPLNGEALTNQLIGSILGTLIILFLAWRTSTGKGWLSAGAMLLFFVVEISFKVAGGTTNVGWMVAYVAVGAMMVNGLRACWWLRRKRPETATMDNSFLLPKWINTKNAGRFMGIILGFVGVVALRAYGQAEMGLGQLETWVATPTEAMGFSAQLPGTAMVENKSEKIPDGRKATATRMTVERKHFAGFWTSPVLYAVKVIEYPAPMPFTLDDFLAKILADSKNEFVSTTALNVGLFPGRRLVVRHDDGTYFDQLLIVRDRRFIAMLMVWDDNIPKLFAPSADRFFGTLKIAAPASPPP